ncbi:MAG: CHASE2 domain-containing protein [Alphaproteobacteria bacterium]|nr:CHASE2 domain-containing protein [Alphaproteobacteria bacterium]
MANSSFFSRSNFAAAPPLAAGVVALCVIALLALASAPVREGGARAGLFDLYQRLAPMEGAPVQRFHVIEIDKDSINRIGPWPWPRSELGRVVAAAKSAGARGIIIVEPVDAPDPLSPGTIGSFWLEGARDNRLAEELARLPDTDAALGRALEGVDAAVAIDPGPNAAASERPDLTSTDPDAAGWVRFDIATENAGLQPLPAGARVALLGVEPRGAVAEPIAARARIAVGALPTDEDGVFRAPTLIWSLQGAAAPGIPLAAAIVASGEKSAVAHLNASATTPFGRLISSISIGETGPRLPLDSRGRAVIGWPKRVEAPTTPAWRLVDAAGGSNAQLAGKVALVGLSSDLGGYVRTPIGELSRVQASAVVADRLVAGAVAARPGWIGYVEAALVMALGAAAMVWSQKMSFWRSMGLAGIAGALVLGASIAAYAGPAVLFNPFPAMIALFVGAIAVAGGRSFGEALSDEKVRGNFRGALPEPTMRALREEGARDVLEGARREITVLACEVSFMEEDLERFAGRAGDLTAMIASACQSLRKAIVEFGGAADQGDGGKVFGYYNAPLETADHPKAACSAALRLVEAMDKINAGLNGPGGRDVQLRLSIGISIGECLVGPMGQGRSNRYSAIGEPMDIAQHLRKQAGVYGPAIICDETIHRRTHHHFAYLELDRVDSTENRRPMTFYALVGNPFVKSSKSFRALDGAHRDMLSAYRSGDAQAARLNLLRARRSPGANIPLFDIYEKRILAMDGADAPLRAETNPETVSN